MAQDTLLIDSLHQTVLSDGLIFLKIFLIFGA